MRFFSLVVGAAVVIAACAACGGGGSSQYLCNDPNDPSSCSPYTPPAPEVSVVPVPVLPPGCERYQAVLLYPGRTQLPGAEYAGTMYVEVVAGPLPAPYVGLEVLRKDAAGDVTVQTGTALQTVAGALPSYVPAVPASAAVYASTHLALDGAVAFDVELVDERFPPVCPPQDLGGVLAQSVVRGV